ncbi:MAG: hypothetical protein CMM25_05265, partial [Rhodospirillaceae bacterium]|nr:hypothetical protein [Rhodospirillaceae bacterium]
MKNIINICYCIDSSFLPLTVKSINNIRGFFKSKDHTLKFYIISNEDIPDIPKSVVFIKNKTVPVSLVQLRSFIPEMLGVDRVLYIDADTIISTCISKLWEINITGFPVGAVQHCYFKTFTDAAKFYRFPISLYNTDRYFNSGVLLIDCIKWNDNKLTEKACDAFDLYKH